MTDSNLGDIVSFVSDQECFEPGSQTLVAEEGSVRESNVVGFMVTHLLKSLIIKGH